MITKNELTDSACTIRHPGTERRRVAGALLLLALAVLAMPSAWALGFRIPNQDPAAIARGNAFVATADNPSAIYYNPAGITQLEGQNFQISSLFYLHVYADFDPAAGGARVENEREILPVPAMHYTYTPEESRFSFGLGVFAPFGLSMTWPDSAPFSTVGLSGSVNYITFNPVVAYKICNSLSVAAGPTISYTTISLQRAIGVVPGDEFSFRGTDTVLGFNLGLLWQPHQQWSFGASYRSATSPNYSGNATLSPSFLGPSAPTSAKVNMPQIVIGGVSYRPTTNWNIEVNVDWADWGSLKQVDVVGYGVVPFYWKSSFLYEIGVTRYFRGGWFASIGYFYSEDSTSKTFYNPIIPDGNINVGTIGVGRNYEHWRWAMAFEYINGRWNNITSPPAQGVVAGSYRLYSPAVSFSLGYHF